MHKDKHRGLRLAEPGGGIRETYSNHVTLCSTESDVRIAFGQVVPIGGNTAAEAPGQTANNGQLPFQIEQRVAVTMSWLQAKAMTQVLEDTVARFEAKNGEIKKQVAP
jgi:hypothetical protein